MNDYTQSEFLYRVEHMVYETTGLTPHVWKFPIKRVTAKCFVIDCFGRERFILKFAKKRYAYPTLKEAFDSF
jgi:hypothetical protein